MLEQVSAPSHREQTTNSPDAGLVRLAHLDVASLMKEKNAFFIHTIQVLNKFDVPENNRSIDTRKLDVADKLDLLYGTNPTLSASTVRPHTNDGTRQAGFGVVFSHGEVESAHTADVDTIAISHKKRHIIGGAKNAPEDVDKAINRTHVGDQKSYNEIVLKDPEVAGGFMKLESFRDRISYEEEEKKYYDGETVISRIGIIDFSNPVDRLGRPTGVSYDKPLSVLVEMGDRGKVFVMDEDNQLHIVTSIDKEKRKVEFNAAPITPSDFAYYYGKEKINPYTKREMLERLKGSLEKKGLTLQEDV
jgi:hypothetical protein